MTEFGETDTALDDEMITAATVFPLKLTVNGKERVLMVEGRRMLVDVLRQDLRLTGTHAACDQGVCGACTVRVDGETLRSCITLAIQVDGSTVRTVEGMADSSEQLGAVQQGFWEMQGLQCGFCTPGMMLRVEEILEANPAPTREEVREGISSNLCRCTGYQFIVDAAMRAAEIRSGSEVDL